METSKEPEPPESPAPPPPAFNPRGRGVFEAMGYGLIDGARFGLRWAVRWLGLAPKE
jgi:hypothetical protein